MVLACAPLQPRPRDEVGGISNHQKLVHTVPEARGVLDLNLYGDVPTKKIFSPCSRILPSNDTLF